MNNNYSIDPSDADILDKSNPEIQEEV